MPKVVLKNYKANYENSPAIKNVLKYVMSVKDSKEPVDYWGTRGLLKDINHAYRVIDNMQKYLKSDYGKRLYHFSLSFPEEIKDERVIYIIANAIADYLGQEYQLVFGVHMDTDNYHIHYAMNAVSYRTCLKWHKKNDEFPGWFKNIRKMAENLLLEYGY